ncbi:MAG: hypothetical protein L6W00_10660 [Lentisphaeria bacterium]|nr:MAG: hypothetical protein L6W00_10660 [Lentisphaeria bacterium]
MIRFVYGVCGLFTTVMAMCAFADMTRQSNGFGVIAAGMEFMAWGTFSGLFLTGAFLPEVTERFADAVFYPIRRLKKTRAAALPHPRADRHGPVRRSARGLPAPARRPRLRPARRLARLVPDGAGELRRPRRGRRRCGALFCRARRSAAPEYAELLRRWFISAAGTEAEERVRARIREELHRHRRVYSPGERRELEALLEQP